MNPEELKLTHVNKEAIISDAVFRNAWVTDPPPHYLHRMPDELVTKIYGIKMRHLSRLAKIEAQIKEIEAEMYNDLVKAMG
jgi:hypothetical protein